MLKSVIDLVPDKAQKKAITQALDEAEKSFAIAQAEAALSVGYMLCRCSWPPSIMIEKQPNQWHCEKCHRTADTSPSKQVISARSEFRQLLDKY